MSCGEREKAAEMGHTPEPWKSFGRIKVSGCWHVGCAIDGTNKVTALTGYSGAGDEEESIANARRIAACVNWCAGNSTEGMERAVSIGRPYSVERDKAIERELDLVQQRDELLAALEAIRKKTNLDMHSDDGSLGGYAYGIWNTANTAIASVKGGA